MTNTLQRISSSVRGRDDVHVLAALLAVTAWGIGPIFNKAMTVSTPSIVFYRMLLGVPLMNFMAIRMGGGLTKELMRKTAVPGVLFAFSFIAGFASMKMTSIANATLITTIQPVLILFVAPKMFGEKIRQKQLLYSVCAMAGVLTVVLAAASTSGAKLSGDLMAVTNVVLWTAYFVLAKQTRMAGVHSWSFLAAVFTWASVVILPFGLITSNDLTAMTTKDWYCVVGMTIIPGVVGHGMMTWSQSHIDVTLASLLGLLSPVISTGLAWAIFSQALTVWQMVGAAVVLGSLAFLVQEQRGTPGVALEHEG
ncbi:MAG: EamA family transporter [Actinobacteria bacterium]|nr:EamA family transporter [Actinomycetota bacterium]